MENNALEMETKNLGDLPPEVLTIILEFIAGQDDQKRSKMLTFRLVNTQWKDILDSLVEKRIVSSELPVFPGMKIGESDPSDIRVFCSRAWDKPIPFNSLLLQGNARADNFPLNHADNPMALSDFISTFGGNLTSFAVHDQDFTIQTLAIMLSSMPNLKLLNFKDVKYADSTIGLGSTFPIAPQLTSLIALELEFTLRYLHIEAGNDKRNILYVWIIASYADQIVRLKLKTEIPALQKRHQYSYSFPSGETLSIATTTDSAFEKLKELKMYCHSPNFLRLSETPWLQKLSIHDLAPPQGFDLEDLVQFIQKCVSTLEELCLDINWSEFLLTQNNKQDFLDAQILTGVNCTKLKTLAIHFPRRCAAEIMLSRLVLVMFQDLKVLHFIRFVADDEERWEDLDEPPMFGFENEVDVVVLKERLISLQQNLTDSTLRYLQERAAVRRGERVRANQDEDFDRADLNLLLEIFDVGAAADEEMVSILGRLTSLGETVERFIVEQLLERQGIWNVCGKLKLVDVSSGDNGMANGEICVIWRSDNV